MKSPRLTVWDCNGRELTCFVVPSDHPLRVNHRVGYFCKVMRTNDHLKNLSHVYFEGPDFTGPCYFYKDSKWWMCQIAFPGWDFSFAAPRATVLKQELTVLTERILEINKELSTLR